MKNSRKGFIVPLLLTLVAILLVGGGVYVYVQDKQANQPIVVTQPAQTTSTAQTSTTTTGTHVNFCHTFNTDLTIGSSIDISDLRKALSRNGFLQVGSSKNPFKSASGPTLDENDSENIVKFQAKYGIRQTGSVDSATRAKLNALYGCSLNQYQLNQSVRQVLRPDVSPVHDADIRDDLSRIQIQAEIYYDGAGSNTYTGVCASPSIAKMLTAARTANGGTIPTCNASATAYAISSPFFSNSTKFWCVDSMGSNIQTATPLGTKTVCK